MKYYLTIRANKNIPENKVKAWWYHYKMLTGELVGETADFTNIIKKVKLQFPDISLSMIWGDYLIINKSDTYAKFDINSPKALEMAKFIKEMAIEENFAVFDPAENKIYRSE